MADQRIQATEDMVGAGHATKTDTLNRLAVVEHNSDGTHKNTINVGDGAAGDKQINANNADAGKPYLKYDDTANGWKVSNNGVAEFSMAAGGARGLFSNLIGRRPTAATVRLTADSVALVDTSGGVVERESGDVTIDITASGVNGLDTGAEAAGAWYAKWWIWNGTTLAGLLSLSATAPTMPSGYTFKAFAGWVYNDSGSNFIDYYQRGANVSFIGVTKGAIKVGDNVPAGATTAIVALSLSAAVPPSKVRSVSGKLGPGVGGGFLFYYGGHTFTGPAAVNDSDNAPYHQGLNVSTAADTHPWFVRVLKVDQMMYIAKDQANAAIFTDIWVSEYEIDF